MSTLNKLRKAIQEEIKKTLNESDDKADLTAANQFVDDLKSFLQIGDRVVNCSVQPNYGFDKAKSSVYVNFYNLPSSVRGGGGAEAENNRMSFSIQGFGDAKMNGKVKVEHQVSAFPREFRLRGKQGSPTAVAQYLANFLNDFVKKVEPKFTHTKMNESQQEDDLITKAYYHGLNALRINPSATRPEKDKKLMDLIGGNDDDQEGYALTKKCIEAWQDGFEDAAKNAYLDDNSNEDLDESEVAIKNKDDLNLTHAEVLGGQAFKMGLGPYDYKKDPELVKSINQVAYLDIDYMKQIVKAWKDGYAEAEAVFDVYDNGREADLDEAISEEDEIWWSACRLGELAFENGKQRVPAQDSKLMSFIYNNHHEKRSKDLMGAWLDGWDARDTEELDGLDESELQEGDQNQGYKVGQQLLWVSHGDVVVCTYNGPEKHQWANITYVENDRNTNGIVNLDNLCSVDAVKRVIK